MGLVARTDDVDDAPASSRKRTPGGSGAALPPPPPQPAPPSQARDTGSRGRAAAKAVNAPTGRGRGKRPAAAVQDEMEKAGKTEESEEEVQTKSATATLTPTPTTTASNGARAKASASASALAKGKRPAAEEAVVAMRVGDAPTSSSSSSISSAESSSSDEGHELGSDGAALPTYARKKASVGGSSMRGRPRGGSPDPPGAGGRVGGSRTARPSGRDALVKASQGGRKADADVSMGELARFLGGHALGPPRASGFLGGVVREVTNHVRADREELSGDDDVGQQQPEVKLLKRPGDLIRLEDAEQAWAKKKGPRESLSEVIASEGSARSVLDGTALKKRAKGRRGKGGIRANGELSLVNNKHNKELKRALTLVRLRDAMDPKRFYKSLDGGKKKKSRTNLNNMQLGTVVAGPADYYGGELTRKARKATLPEEILANKTMRQYLKEKYNKLRFDDYGRRIPKLKREGGPKKWKKRAGRMHRD